MSINTSASTKKIIITGGAGFLGSHIVEAFAAAQPTADIVIIDKMTYAAHPSHIEHLTERGRARLIVGDVTDLVLLSRIFEGADLVIHAAAESHVDRSFRDPFLFTNSNVVGTHTVLEAARLATVPLVIHVSTDEVYGEVPHGEVYEDERFNPTNPYSASKAAAEMIVGGYRHSFRLPVITVRGNNAYGIRQFPEKLIPRAIMALATGERIPLHGSGMNTRHYLSAVDFANAIVLLSTHGVPGETYNLGSRTEYSNREVAQLICEQFGRDFEEVVSYVADRPKNDRRYSVSWGKLRELGWQPEHALADDMPRIVEWYRENLDMLKVRMAEQVIFATSLAQQPVVRVRTTPFGIFMADIGSATFHV